jgi:hypothetical protein
VFNYRRQFSSATTRSNIADKLNLYEQVIQEERFAFHLFNFIFSSSRRAALAQRAVVPFSSAHAVWRCGLPLGSINFCPVAKGYRRASQAGEKACFTGFY